MKKKIVIAAIALASVFAGTVAFESFTGQNEAKAKGEPVHKRLLLPGTGYSWGVDCLTPGDYVCVINPN